MSSTRLIVADDGDRFSGRLAAIVAAAVTLGPTLVPLDRPDPLRWEGDDS